MKIAMLSLIINNSSKHKQQQQQQFTKNVVDMQDDHMSSCCDEFNPGGTELVDWSLACCLTGSGSAYSWSELIRALLLLLLFLVLLFYKSIKLSVWIIMDNISYKQWINIIIQWNLKSQWWPRLRASLSIPMVHPYRWDWQWEHVLAGHL